MKTSNILNIYLDKHSYHETKVLINSAYIMLKCLPYIHEKILYTVMLMYVYLRYTYSVYTAISKSEWKLSAVDSNSVK